MKKFLFLILMSLIFAVINPAEASYIEDFGIDKTKYALSNLSNEIYENYEGETAYINANGVLMPIQSEEFSLFEKESVDRILSLSDLSQEVKEDIFESHLEAVKDNDIYAKGIVMSNALNITGSASSENTRVTSSDTYAYKGYMIRDDFFSVKDRYTGFKNIITGIGTKSSADTITNIVINGISLTSTGGVVMTILDTGASLLSMFQKETNQYNFNSSTGDILQFALRYNSTRKYTYVLSNGVYNLGLVSRFIYMKEMSIYQAYQGAKNDYLKKISRYETFYSENYRSAADYAIKNYLNSHTKKESVFWKVYRTTFEFSH